jgi:Na+-driven multidrug efflux pump
LALLHPLKGRSLQDSRADSRAPQYANLGILISVTVLPIALIFGLATAIGGYSLAAPVGGSIGMLILAVIIHRRSVVDE